MTRQESEEEIAGYIRLQVNVLDYIVANLEYLVVKLDTLGIPNTASDVGSCIESVKDAIDIIDHRTRLPLG